MTQDFAHIEAALHAAAAIVDVRSPGEFAKGAVAGAVNQPLFSNGQRAEIGTIYKHLGPDAAIQTGLTHVGGRLPAFVEGFRSYQGQRLLVYCARGGMRSQSVVSLLAALGFDVAQLPGGYKAFRNYLLDALARMTPPRPLILHGCTGVGKTDLLHRLPNALDLEGLAQHRSSLFGAVNLQPRTQQQFEALLLATLQALDFHAPVWIEGESRKVGDAVIPQGLRDAIRTGPAVLVTASVQTRARRIIAEYGADDPATLAQLEDALASLRPHYGARPTEHLLEIFRAGDLETVVTTLLVDYYDPRYLHAMRDYNYALEVSSENLDEAAATLRAFGRAQGALPPGACSAGSEPVQAAVASCPARGDGDPQSFRAQAPADHLLPPAEARACDDN